jgi:glutamine synthetase type III
VLGNNLQLRAASLAGLCNDSRGSGNEAAAAVRDVAVATDLPEVLERVCLHCAGVPVPRDKSPRKEDKDILLTMVSIFL